ncbi:TIGR04283 family arsenosugar biosynthesis glycosyltransferase [Sphingomonas sp. LY54]|uniref:TIGR04283 family arsenosugar biosynthesis glycosyltransferase n=1 Tax=Sphingomonas sp. LY54 TaxID=3095343 RepID=UPI002D76C0D5|nr:TIGR04283 family arsenosugar biosynthesis glycosyltransferase [Sphingomonas sp. LY54]WRP27903.1 TIGR04283 family arsenosugar biosynthesis glycosyltransferase [Sphingomonas sp. LY54]
MLSIVIPTLNAAASLPAGLERLAGVDEILVVDGGSGDATVAVARAAGARVIVAPRGRGPQLQAGGEAARGDWLLFLHADTLLGAGWRAAVEAHQAQRPRGAACFRFRLDDPAWQARLIERGVAARVRLLGLPYGDQGLLVPRLLYERVGGFRPLPLMEDVDLVRRLGRVRVLAADAVTGAERWRRDGWLRRSATNLLCLLLYRLGVPAERVALLYR